MKEHVAKKGEELKEIREVMGKMSIQKEEDSKMEEGEWEESGKEEKEKEEKE